MPTKSVHPIDVSYKVFVKFFLVVGGALLLYILSDVFAALLFAVVIASAMEPVILWFKKYKIPRIAGVIIIYLSVFLIFAVIFYFLIPTLAEEFESFQNVYYAYQSRFLSELKEFEGLPFLDYLSDGAEIFLENGSIPVGQLTGNAFGILSAIFGGLLSVVILIVVSFYLSTQENGIENFLRLVTPIEYEEYAIDLWTRSQKKMGHWLRAQLLLGVLIGILVFIALTFLGIKYALLLAFVSAVFELIPVVGPIMAAAPAAFTAFLQDPILAVIVVLVYFVVQQLESHLIVPVVMRKTVGLNPLVVVVALLVGAKLGGILGLFLAVPIASVLVEFVIDIDRRKRGLLQEVHSS